MLQVQFTANAQLSLFQTPRPIWIVPGPITRWLGGGILNIAFYSPDIVVMSRSFTKNVVRNNLSIITVSAQVYFRIVTYQNS